MRLFISVVSLVLALGVSVMPGYARSDRASSSCLLHSGQGCPSGVYVGVWQPGVPTNMDALQTFEQDAARHMAIVMLWRDWAGPSSTLDPAWLDEIAAHGSVPLVTWSPDNWNTGTAYSLNAIASGQYDSYITGWAQLLAQYGRPVLLRWASEMNGDWYGWSGHPSEFVAAWRHIHQIFTQNGATNVQWVWSPSVFWPHSQAVDPKAYYPGKKYVDWLGLAGYNFSKRGWMSFGQIYGPAYKILTKRYSQPVMITEMGSGEASATEARQGHSKATWIRTAFTHDIPARPRIKAVIWFNEDKTGSDSHGENWRIESSPAAQHAFASALRQKQYRTYLR
jgi:mannan endo-1,4-beta-mannosidase